MCADYVEKDDKVLAATHLSDKETNSGLKLGKPGEQS